MFSGGFSGGFSGSPGKSGDRGKSLERSDKEDSDDDQLSEWEWTPAERRRFNETGVRPTETSRNAERATRAAQNIPHHRRPTNPRIAEEVAQDLRNQIREAIKNAIDENGTDDELLEVLNSRFAISQSERPSENHILDGAVQYMNITNQVVAREAVITLAEANWDIEYAVARYFDGRPAAPMPVVESRTGDRSRSSSELSPPPEGPSEPSGPEEQEGESESEDIMNRLNSQVDREPAKKGRRDDSKLRITLKTPGNKEDLEYAYPKAINGTLDFTDSKTVRALNRWRSQILRRQLGPVRSPRARFLDVEKRFLIDAVKGFERQRNAARQAVNWNDMDWHKVTHDYNAVFKGRRLPGSQEPRPERTYHSLITERNRLKEITDLTGGAPRDQNKTADEPETDSEKDRETAEPKPKHPRRGDPPPGKRPRRRSPDSDDEDTHSGENASSGMVGIRA